MKVGNREILHFGTYLIPKGETVTGTVFIGNKTPARVPVASLNSSEALLVTKDSQVLIAEPLPTGTAPQSSDVSDSTLNLELRADYDPDEADKNRLKWRFLPDGPTWQLTICGPFSGVSLG